MSVSSSAAHLPVFGMEGGLSRYLAEIRKFPFLTADEEATYAQRWRNNNDRKAAYHLVTSHLRLAAKIALRYRGYGLPVADLISEANVGLMVAVKRFEPDKGVRLATYAMWWIKATVQEYILRSWSLVKIGTTAAQKKLFFNLRKLKNQLSASEEYDLLPDHVDHISNRLQVAPQEVVEMNGRIRGDVSLNAPVATEVASEEMQDLIVDPSADPESLFSEAEERRNLMDALAHALCCLSERERKIIEARFLNDRRQTLDDLSRDLGISGERTRQIEERALQKLRATVTAYRNKEAGSVVPAAGQKETIRPGRRQGTPISTVPLLAAS
jgi:RNA polymerase sigma-32 factor